MRYFLDSSDPDKIEAACQRLESQGIHGLHGVTTNPSLAKQSGLHGGGFKSHILYLANRFGKQYPNFRHVSAQTLGVDDGSYDPATVSADVYEAQARMIYGWNRALDFDSRGHQVIVPKIPCIPEGLKAVRRLARDMDVNVTLCFNPEQARLAALAGARYISPFIGRLDDLKVEGLYGKDGADLLHDISALYRMPASNPHFRAGTQILVASTRIRDHITAAFREGCHIVTWRDSLFFEFAGSSPETFAHYCKTGAALPVGERRVMLDRSVPEDVEQWPGFNGSEFHSPRNRDGLTLAEAGNAQFLRDAKAVAYDIAA